MQVEAATDLLDDVDASIEDDTRSAFWRLLDGLQAMKCSLGEARWLECAAAACRAHPLRKRLDQDPFTSRSARRPRGYPGDAELLDFIYLGLPAALAGETTPLGRRLFQETAGRSPSARSVRARRDLLAARLDRLARERNGARVLSVACGHLHEARQAPAVQEGRLSELVALDHDPLTLARLDDLADAKVTPLRASVKDVLGGTALVGTFDFVYAAGLYDYLSDRTAALLTRALFDRLRPGGELLIGNFVPGFRGSAYMESFMDWRLTARTEDRLRDCLLAVDPRAVAESNTWEDDEGCVAYLTARRAG